MRLDKNIKYLLLSLTIILNLILRYPATPHEIGWDSFDIHILANSISTFGCAKWWINSMSIGGFYPYSYASAIPFFLSGISQITGISMEWTIWLFCEILGMLSIIASYTVAGSLNRNDIFKFMVSLGYSTSVGILYFSTWTVSTRGTFIVLFPIYVFLLIKSVNSFKYIFLNLILFILLFFTHHLFYYLIPMAAAYVFVLIASKISNIKLKNQFFKNREIINSIIVPSLFIIMFAIPFFSRTFIESGSRYGYLINQLTEYIRVLGFPIVFVVGGFIYLLIKRNKNFNEWFLIITLLLLTPLIYVNVYTKWFMILFAFVLFGISLANIVKYGVENNKRYIPQMLIIIFIISTIFLGYLQFLTHLHNLDTDYMDKKSYASALWIKDSISNKNNMIGSWPVSTRIFAISKVPTLMGSVSDISYNFVNLSELTVVQKYSILSPGFYLYEPFYETNPSSSFRLDAIRRTNISHYDSYAQRFVKFYNISYHVEDMYTTDEFTRSIQQLSTVYDNGRIRVRSLK